MLTLFISRHLLAHHFYACSTCVILFDDAEAQGLHEHVSGCKVTRCKRTRPHDQQELAGGCQTHLRSNVDQWSALFELALQRPPPSDIYTVPRTVVEISDDSSNEDDEEDPLHTRADQRAQEYQIDPTLTEEYGFQSGSEDFTDFLAYSKGNGRSTLGDGQEVGSKIMNSRCLIPSSTLSHQQLGTVCIEMLSSIQNEDLLIFTANRPLHYRRVWR